MNEGRSVSRKTEGGFIVVAIIILSSIGATSLLWTQPQSNQDHQEPNYKLTVWLQSINSSFTLHIDIYNTASDVGSTDSRLLGIGCPVDSDTIIPLTFLLFNIPQDTEGIWAEVYIQEGVSVTAYLGLGVKKTVLLRDCPLEMLFEELKV